MKVKHKAGTRSSWKEMDLESRLAVKLSEGFVRDKRSVIINGKSFNHCMLVMHYGNNILTTQIEIIDCTGLTIAFFSEGFFYDVITKNRVELI